MAIPHFFSCPAEVADRDQYFAFVRFGYALSCDPRMGVVWHRLEVVFANDTSSITDRFDRVAHHCLHMLAGMDHAQRYTRDQKVLYLLWAIGWLMRTASNPNERKEVR